MMIKKEKLLTRRIVITKRSLEMIITKKRKFVDYVNNKNIRALKLEVSNCGKTYQMNHVLLKKQEPIILFTKSLNQYRKIKAQKIRWNTTVKRI